MASSSRLCIEWVFIYQVWRLLEIWGCLTWGTRTKWCGVHAKSDYWRTETYSINILDSLHSMWPPYNRLAHFQRIHSPHGWLHFKYAPPLQNASLASTSIDWTVSIRVVFICSVCWQNSFVSCITTAFLNGEKQPAGFYWKLKYWSGIVSISSWKPFVFQLELDLTSCMQWAMRLNSHLHTYKHRVKRTIEISESNLCLLYSLNSCVGQIQIGEEILMTEDPLWISISDWWRSCDLEAVQFSAALSSAEGNYGFG